MSENFVDKENTFALWKVGNSHVVGASKFLLDTDVVQQSMRVVASSTSPMFLAYADSGQEHPAELDLYMIVSSDGK